MPSFHPMLDYSKLIPYQFTNITRCSKYEKIYRAVDILYERKVTYFILKNKNKKVIPIKDGIVTYKINLSPKIECQCYQYNTGANGTDRSNSDIYCNHILYLFSKIYKMSDLIITFIHLKPLHEQFINYIVKNDNISDELNNILEGELANYFKEEVCGICLSSLDDKKFNYDIFICDQCSNYVHSKCMDDWMNIKIKTIPNMEKGCIYCRLK